MYRFKPLNKKSTYFDCTGAPPIKGIQINVAFCVFFKLAENGLRVSESFWSVTEVTEQVKYKSQAVRTCTFFGKLEMLCVFLKKRNNKYIYNEMEGIYAIVYLASYDVVFLLCLPTVKTEITIELFPDNDRTIFIKKIHLKHTYRDFLKTTEY